MMDRLKACVAGVLACGLAASCTPVKPEPPPQLRPTLPKKEVADFLKGTIWEYVDLANAEPMRVSGFGLVVNLDGTGDTRAPNSVRDYMIKQMQKHGFGSSVQAGFERMGPEQVLNDPGHRVAIVRVDGFIPPGAHKNQLFDVQVSALENSNTTRLHRGLLYESDLSPRGADPNSPGAGTINPMARVSGPVFVNPAASLNPENASTNQKLSLRYGVVMGRGIAMDERPLVLKLRSPEQRIARAVERRIDERFQDSKLAAAQNEGEVYVRVPPQYGEDWEHFAGVVLHLPFNPEADYAEVKAKQLAEMAARDREKAPLMDISLMWEALGKPALTAIEPLLRSDSPDVAFAAARAAAYLDDASGAETLVRIAKIQGHPFQLNAIRVLGTLKGTANATMALRDLLNGDQNTVRIEAYKALVAMGDAAIFQQSMRERFLLDIIPSEGPPLIYASQLGTPRIALIGRPPQLAMPIVFMTMNNQFNIVSDPARGSVKLFDRNVGHQKEVAMETSPDLAVIISRMAGDGPAAENGARMNFTYGDIVAVLKQLADQKRIVASDKSRIERIAMFQLQALPSVEDPILSAPAITDSTQRPQGAPDAPDAAVPDPSVPDPSVAPRATSTPAPGAARPVAPAGPVGPVSPTATGQRPQN
jgi:hypothetical protein